MEEEPVGPVGRIRGFAEGFELTSVQPERLVPAYPEEFFELGRGWRSVFAITIPTSRASGEHGRAKPISDMKIRWLTEPTASECRAHRPEARLSGRLEQGRQAFRVVAGMAKTGFDPR